MKDTCESAIVKAFMNARNERTDLSKEPRLAVHELGRRIKNHSQNSIATKLSQMALLGRVDSNYREGKRYKEWTFISCLLVMALAGCGVAPKKNNPVVWDQPRFTAKTADGKCFAISLGFEDGGNVKWNSNETECPKVEMKSEPEAATKRRTRRRK